MEQLLTHIEEALRTYWISTLISMVLIVGLTALLAQLFTRFLSGILHYNEQKNLPSTSIFINIARASIWIIGLCVVLSTCFKVDVSAAVAALGIGGIAISLGFQDTISNLIGGLQVSLMRIVKPGDHIQVGTSTGVVKDITWRHTNIKNALGQEIIIPNSIINKTALTHLPPTNEVNVAIVVTAGLDQLDQVAQAIQDTASSALVSVGKLTKEPAFRFSEITETGFKGMLSFRMADSRTTLRARDVVVRAVAPYTRQAPGAQCGGKAQDEDSVGVYSQTSSCQQKSELETTFIRPLACSGGKEKR